MSSWLNCGSSFSTWMAALLGFSPLAMMRATKLPSAIIFTACFQISGAPGALLGHALFDPGILAFAMEAVRWAVAGRHEVAPWTPAVGARSEERRVGKACRSGEE